MRLRPLKGRCKRQSDPTSLAPHSGARKPSPEVPGCCRPHLPYPCVLESLVDLRPLPHLPFLAALHFCSCPSSRLFLKCPVLSAIHSVGEYALLWALSPALSDQVSLCQRNVGFCLCHFSFAINQAGSTLSSASGGGG